MDSQRLQSLLKEVQINIDDFKKGLAESESQYHESLKVITDPGLRSSLMERYVIHTERQSEALSKMETVFDQVKDQVARLNKSN